MALLALLLAIAAGPYSRISRKEIVDHYGYSWAASVVVIWIRDLDDRPLTFLLHQCGCSAGLGDGSSAYAAKAAAIKKVSSMEGTPTAQRHLLDLDTADPFQPLVLLKDHGHAILQADQRPQLQYNQQT